MSKAPVKKQAASKIPASADKKTAVKTTATKPVPKPAPAKPAAAEKPAPAAKPVAAPKSAAAAKTVATPAAAKTAAAPSPAATVAPAPAKPPRSASARAAAARAMPQQIMQLPSPAPFANRFTDRFAPARAPARAMADADELPRAAHKPNPKLANAWKSKAGRELTDDEVLAMPEAEYMNDKQVDFFRARLQQQKDDLLSNAGETTEHLREDTSIVPDPADRATIEEEHALELRTRDRERKLLKKIAQSLGRLEHNEYGFCDETGEPIGLARLMARPTATLSLEAQQRRELKQKMFGD